MVFFFDDIADAGILGVASLIFASLFPEMGESLAGGMAAFDTIFAEESAPIISSSISANVTQGSSVLLIQDLLGEEGLETAVDIASGNIINYENLPVGQKELDIAEKVLETVTLTNQTNPTYLQALKNSIGRIVQQVSLKIPSSGEGFIKLISDIVRPLINNPTDILATGAVVSSASTIGYNAIQKIKSSFDRDENLPDDIQKKLIEGEPNIGDDDDLLLGQLPSTIT
jgi:hypothetical protein